MGVLTITRILVTRMVIGPAGAVSGLALLSAWPLLLVLAPTGISSSRVLPEEWSYELAFVGQAVGCVLGLASLERIAPLMSRDRSTGRLVAEWIALAACGSAGATIALVPTFVFAGGAANTPATAAGEFLLSLAAIATAAAALVRLKTAPGLAPWLLASGILFAPMLLPLPVPPSSQVLLATGFAGAAWLLDHPPTIPVRVR